MKFGKFFRSPKTSIILFLLAAALLIPAGIGGTLAALNIQSRDYYAKIELSDVYVMLTESNEDGGANPIDIGVDPKELDTSGDRLLKNLVPGGNDKFALGKTYKEYLGVHNIGVTPEYVRVSVYKYWMKDGEKAVDLDPSLIELAFLTNNGWVIDQNASTDERTVLYYLNSPLAAGGVSAPFTESLTINNKAAGKDYENAEFWIEAIVDAVQTHNSSDAIKSVWGIDYAGLAGN